MNEAETRAEHIDPALKAAGWGVVEGSRIRREYPITLGRLEGAGQRGKPLTADYVLEYRNAKLAVLEAKAWDKPLTEGVGQAKNYAGKLAIRFAYASNGQGLYGIDMHTGIEGELACYPSPDELWNRLFVARNIWRDRFAAVPFEDRSGFFQGRYYQDLAIDRAMAAIADGRARILLTLATGTGKTFIAFQIAWKLFHARWNLRRDGERRPRILFLADRNMLADQAFNAFSAFEDDARVRIDPASIRRKGQVPTNGSVFFTIFQTFMSGPENTPFFGEYPADFFDLIVIDECHRGGANDESTWRGILEYFNPAVQLGLTATPKRDVNADTYRYFGEPVYTYSLKEGINDGFLTPFKVREYRTNLDDYTYTTDDTVVEGEVEAGTHFPADAFNRTIVIEERERHRVKAFLVQMDPHEKSLVFCENQAHALLVRDLINQEKESRDPNYCHRVTADDGKVGEEHLRNFQDNERTIPTILTTSQKLSTGVDARNVRHIVLLRRIQSMVEFKQIIGRGTRLYDGKDYFTIHDFTRSHELFKDPAWDGEEMDPKPPGPAREPKPYPEPPDVPPDPGPKEPEPKPKIRIKLADGKERLIQHTVRSSFWGADGTPISAEQFIRQLFGELPALFSDEEELRAIWSRPDTRRKLLEELAEKGFPINQLEELQRIIDARHCDLYDVLAYIAYSQPPRARTERAEDARAHFNAYSDPQRAFLDFVLQQYVRDGVQELDQEKLPPLLLLKYRSLPDAAKDLGDIASIRETFAGFQQWLYR
jgi:type I restriction enzyme R subunit